MSRSRLVTYKRLGLVSADEANVSVSAGQVKVSVSGFNILCPSMLSVLHYCYMAVSKYLL